MKTDLVSKYDYLFKHNANNSIKNIIIYNEKDDWSIDQNYESIDIREHQIWEDLFEKVYKNACKYSTDIYKKGLNILIEKNDMFKNKMPNLNNVSMILNNYTEWNIKVVAGFVDEIIFFELLRDRFFPSSDIIRLSDRFYKKYKNTQVRNDLAYTPEPDIFHEIFGHAPFLLSNEYCSFLKNIGTRGCEIIFSKVLSEDLKSHNLKRLQNFVWWTLEFGLFKSSNDLGYEIYGAGILSSSSEIDNVIDCVKNNQKKLIKYDINEVIMTRFDYSELQDRYFVIDSFDILVESFNSNKDLFLFEG